MEVEKPANIPFQKEDIIKNFKENWNTLTKMEKMQFLQTYISAIYAVSEPDVENPRKKNVSIKKLEFYKR